MEGTAVAVFGNNPMQTWGLNNLFKVITSSGGGEGQQGTDQTCRNVEKDISDETMHVSEGPET